MIIGSKMVKAAVVASFLVSVPALADVAHTSDLSVMGAEMGEPKALEGPMISPAVTSLWWSTARVTIPVPFGFNSFDDDFMPTQGLDLEPTKIYPLFGVDALGRSTVQIVAVTIPSTEATRLRADQEARIRAFFVANTILDDAGFTETIAFRSETCTAQITFGVVGQQVCFPEPSADVPLPQQVFEVPTELLAAGEGNVNNG